MSRTGTKLFPLKSRLPAMVLSLSGVEALPKSQEAKRCITNNGNTAGFSA